MPLTKKAMMPFDEKQYKRIADFREENDNGHDHHQSILFEGVYERNAFDHLAVL
jgi:hypothetical protein